MEVIRRKSDAIDHAVVFHALTTDNEQDYQYFKAGVVIEKLCKSQIASRGGVDAFEILHMPKRRQFVMSRDVSIAGVAAVHLSNKCWSDTFAPRIKDLLTKAFPESALRNLAVLPPECKLNKTRTKWWWRYASAAFLRNALSRGHCHNDFDRHSLISSKSGGVMRRWAPY